MEMRNAELDKLSSMLLNSGLACSAGEARRMAQSMTQTEKKVQQNFQANHDAHLRSMVKAPTPDHPAYLPNLSASQRTPAPLYTDESRANLTALWNHRPDPSYVASMKQRAAPSPIIRPMPPHPAPQSAPAPAPAPSSPSPAAFYTTPQAKLAAEMRERALRPAPVHVPVHYETPGIAALQAAPLPAPHAALQLAPEQTFEPPQDTVQQVFHVQQPEDLLAESPSAAPFESSVSARTHVPQDISSPPAVSAPEVFLSQAAPTAPETTVLETRSTLSFQPAPQQAPRSSQSSFAASESAPPAVAAPAAPLRPPADAPEISFREIMDEDARRIYATPQAPRIEGVFSAILENAPNPAYNYVNPRFQKAPKSLPEAGPSLPAAAEPAPLPQSAPAFAALPAPVRPSPPAALPTAADLLEEEDIPEQTSVYTSSASSKGPGKADAPEVKVDLSEMFNFAKRR